MARENLGLFDTPASRREIRFAGAVIGILAAAFLLSLPESSLWIGEVSAFVPTIDAVVCGGELIIATMLYAQAAIFRTRALTLLASGFLFVALMMIPHALTFPGAFAPHGLLGAGLNATGWIMIFRRTAYPLVIMAYAVVMSRERIAEPASQRPPARTLAWVGGAIVLAAAASWLAIRGEHLLPSMFVDRSQAIYSRLTVFNLSNIVLCGVAMAVLLRKRPSVLDIWLLVGLSGWLIQSVVNLPVHARFTLGWYNLFLVILLSHLFVLLALIGEANRVYARLIVSTAAQRRERDARMMTMDAVAASISHEVGQPLAAVNLSASACLSSLSREPPDYQTAIGSLRDAVEAGHRALDALKSVRTTYRRGSGSLSEFRLNELVLETASLLSREFSAARISLKLALDRDLRPILANRVQIHRVLVNLLTNSIEAIDGANSRIRQITIRSSALDGENVIVEIIDTGGGIPQERLEKIFDPFFTTKSSGMGLGLSLSSTIIDEHGGRLWATSDNSGATFHLKLRHRPGADDALRQKA